MAACSSGPATAGPTAWTFRASPEDRRVLGHGKMISLWPLRSGVLVDDGVAYLTGGVFPAEGLFLYALDAHDGRGIWRNDTCGEDPQSRISLQGYLLASQTSLYAPMGRVSPAAFDRKDGKLKYTSYFGKPVGGTYALLAGEDVYTGTEEMVGFRGDPRDRVASFTGRKIVVTSDTAYVATDTQLSALDRKAFPAASTRLWALKAQTTEPDAALRRTPTDELEAKAAALADQFKQAEEQFAAATRWATPSACHEYLILAGNVLFAGGA